MDKKEIAQFKEMLLAEKADLEQELSAISKRDPSSPGGWDATAGDLQTDPADANETADRFEEIEENEAISSTLETELAEVDAALERIEKGTYGICEKTGKPIKMERLEANPAARTNL